MIDIEKYFKKSDLLPAIVQEESTGEVLMLAYMNRESMRKTLETGYTWFWSGSRKELWLIHSSVKNFLQNSKTLSLKPALLTSHQKWRDAVL